MKFKSDIEIAQEAKPSEVIRAYRQIMKND